MITHHSRSSYCKSIWHYTVYTQLSVSFWFKIIPHLARLLRGHFWACHNRHKENACEVWGKNVGLINYFFQCRLIGAVPFSQLVDSTRTSLKLTTEKLLYTSVDYYVYLKFVLKSIIFAQNGMHWLLLSAINTCNVCFIHTESWRVPLCRNSPCASQK